MVKRKRSECSLEEEEEETTCCYIDALPDEIVEDILSRLKTREAARTRTVSRRWRNLELDFTRNLDLDFTDKEYKLRHIRKSVARVLNKHQGDLDHLRIAFNGDGDDPDGLACAFQDWFMIANAKRVQSLDFEVISPKRVDDISYRPVFLPWIVMALNSWERLRSLSLKSVLVDGLDVEVLVANSPNLESLCVEGVPLGDLWITEPMPKLKRLVVQNCGNSQVTITSAPNLEYLKHVTSERFGIAVNFDLFPKLKAFYVGRPVCRSLMCELQESAPQMQKLQLELDVWCHDSVFWKSDITLPKMEDLKQIVISFTFAQEDDYASVPPYSTIGIIRARPCPEKLTRVIEEDEEEEDGDVDHGSNECLKEVKVLSWSGTRFQFRFIRYLIHTSPNLQQLSFPTPSPELEPAAQQLIAYLQKLKLAK